MPSFREAALSTLHQGHGCRIDAALQYIVQERVEFSDAKLVLRLFESAQDSALRLAALIWLSKHKLYNHELSDMTGFAPDTLATIPDRPPKVTLFPVVEPSGRASIAKAIVYILPSVKLKAIALTGQGSSECDHLSNLSGKSCLIGFDTAIEGSSWQLAAMAALLDKGEDPRANIAFSGIVQPNGQITRAEGLPEKAACCKAQGLRLIYRVANCSTLSKWLNGEIIPLPLVQYCGSPNELKRWQNLIETKVQEIYEWFSYADLEDWYGIPSDDLAIYSTEGLRFEQAYWQNYLQTKVRGHFDNLEDKLSPKRALWFYAGQIGSLQFGIGAIFGFKRAIEILQLDFSNSTYKPVFTLHGQNNARELKNVSCSMEECQKVTGKLEVNSPESRELALILYLGSHVLEGDVTEYCKEHLKLDNFLIIQAKHKQGVLDVNANWLPWAQEINSILNHARRGHSWRRIHLFQTAPTALCMALGIAIGHFLPIDIYHYQYNAEHPKYRKVYSLDTILESRT